MNEFIFMSASIETYLKTNAGVTDEEWLQLEQRFQRKKILKGEFLLHKGEVCRHSFFVEEGLLRMYSIDHEGKEHIIQFASENWFITDRASAYFNEPSEYFLEAIENSSVVMLNEDFMKRASEKSLLFRAYNERLLQNHIRHLQKRINLLIGASAEARYLDFIGLYPDLTLRVPQWMIASFLGITPESLSRVRKELAKKHTHKH